MKLTSVERNKHNKALQAALVDAQAALDRAKEAANALEIPFTFLGRVYTPIRIETTGGHFDHEPKPNVDSWDESTEVPWDASGGGVGC